ncbi:MAG: TlpA family protein disulfide reductase [Candidatus Rokuibacteriota bacterium]
MSRTGAIALAVVAVVLVLVSFWLWEEGPTRPSTRVPAPPPATAPSTSARLLDDLMLDQQVTRLAGEPAKPFILPTLGGERFDFAQLAGRPALLYFWATW